MWYNNIIETIGNTPLVKLNKITKDIPATILAKVESFNPGNSIKDRMALRMVQGAEEEGLLKPGGTIVEGTSGNTGMGLALAGIVKGYKCIFVTTDKQSKEKVDILKAVGAEVIVCPTDVEPTDPRSYYSTSKRIAEGIPGSWYVNQYDNPYNSVGHYESTGPEIWEQTEGKITHLVVGVGTGGTISGTGKYLKEKNPDIQILGVDTYGSAIKKYHETGKFDDNEVYSYITEGIGEDIIPENIDFSVIDYFEKVTDKDGAVYARKLAREEGIFGGYSCGSAIAGVLQMKDRFKEGDVVVVILHDHGSRYVGKVYNDEWMRERKFLDNDGPMTAKQILDRKGHNEVYSVEKTVKLKEAIEMMRHNDLSQLPVRHNGDVVGSIDESTILNALLEGGANDVASIMKPPFPKVSLAATSKEISAHIKKGSSAVMVEDIAGMDNIITEYDLIQAMAD